jgi:hypothetical protein
MLLRGDALQRLCLARELLAEVRERPVSIRDAARTAQMSPFHFIRQFDALFGVTPHQFRIQAPRPGKVPSGEGAAFRHRGLYGGRNVQSGQLQRPFCPPRGGQGHPNTSAVPGQWRRARAPYL